MSTVLEISRGRAKTYQLDIKRDGLALSLDGQTLVWVVSRLQDSATADEILRKVSGVSITHAADVVGRAIFSVTAEESALLDPLVTYYWALALIDSAGNPLPVDGLEGTLIPLSTVTI